MLKSANCLFERVYVKIKSKLSLGIPMESSIAIFFIFLFFNAIVRFAFVQGKPHTKLFLQLIETMSLSFLI